MKDSEKWQIKDIYNLLGPEGSHNFLHIQYCEDSTLIIHSAVRVLDMENLQKGQGTNHK